MLVKIIVVARISIAALFLPVRLAIAKCIGWLQFWKG